MTAIELFVVAFIVAWVLGGFVLLGRITAFVFLWITGFFLAPRRGPFATACYLYGITRSTAAPSHPPHDPG